MLHVPEPLPDELAAGHLGRVYAINGIRQSDRETRTIHKLVGDDGCAYQETLASLTGLPISHYLFHHTLLPFFRAVQVGEPFSWRAVDQEFTVRASGHRANQLGAKVCPNCIDEDISFWGFSYWRRTHQLPGVCTCPKHQTGLLRTKPSSPMKLLPQKALDSAEVLSPELYQLATENPTIKRYGEICLEFLGRERSISTIQIVSCLQQRARQLHIRSHAGVVGVHLHDIARNQAGGFWLNAHFPDIESKGSSSSLCRTYSSRKIAYATTYYALALALLYHSTDEAFSDLDSHAAISKASFSDTRGHFKPHENSPGSHGTLHQALNGFLRGMPVEQACKRFGAERHALENILRTATKRLLERRA